MNISQQILSDITVFNKYARYDAVQQRRETWAELVERNIRMHVRRFPEMEAEIRDQYQCVLDKEVLPSMRSIQFAGKAIDVNPSRIFNCSYVPVDDYRAFSEIMFLLLGGVGVGYSVQRHHVDKLPVVRKPVKTRRYVIGDSIEGWADAIKMLIKAYLCGRSRPLFVFDQIRPKGARLVTAGGKAPGPAPLRNCLEQIRTLLDGKEDGDKLTPIECHDIICIMSDAVLAGGIRRAASISLFSIDDQEMMQAKTMYDVDSVENVQRINGSYACCVRHRGKAYNIVISKKDYDKYEATGKMPWFYFYPWRARANNSVVVVRGLISEKRFMEIWDQTYESQSGEPGIFLTNNPEWGVNPCGEVSLRPHAFCNLTTVKVSDVETQEELERRVKVAAFIGTLQATYTDFYYLRDVWRKNTERDALLGISMTGIAMCRNFNKFDLEKAALVAKEENKRLAKLLGIKPAARITCVKPEGTSSCVLGTTSGIHGGESPFYIRRIRINKDDPLYLFLRDRHPELVADEIIGTGAVIEIPQRCPEGAILKTESPTDLLDRVRHVYKNWVLPGHQSGHNTHNVSVTVYVREYEWGAVRNWLWENRDSYTGMTVFPHNGGIYEQAPFEACSEDTYHEMMSHLREVDLSQLKETEDGTNLQGELACAGGVCELQ